MIESSSPDRGRERGEQLKQHAHSIMEAHRESFIMRGRRALLLRLLDAGVATADDVRAVVELPPGIDPKCFGSVPGPLAKAGIIRAAGSVKTTRPTAHARPVTIWELATADKALAWLAAHPDMTATGEIGSSTVTTNTTTTKNEARQLQLPGVE